MAFKTKKSIKLLTKDIKFSKSTSKNIEVPAIFSIKHDSQHKRFQSDDLNNPLPKISRNTNRKSGLPSKTKSVWKVSTNFDEKQAFRERLDQLCSKLEQTFRRLNTPEENKSRYYMRKVPDEDEISHYIIPKSPRIPDMDTLIHKTMTKCASSRKIMSKGSMIPAPKKKDSSSSLNTFPEHSLTPDFSVSKLKNARYSKFKPQNQVKE